MPTITNVHNLPVAFERFNELNAHTKEGADFSVTGLIDAPQIIRLKEEHDHEITEDIADQVMSILGTAIHNILELNAGPDDITERRFHTSVLGKTVSGQCDLMRQMVPGDVTSGWKLEDYKTTRGASLIHNPDGQESWDKQVNTYAYLATENGFRIEEANIIVVVRDWTASLVRRDRRFPKQPVVTLPVKLWPYNEQKQFLEQCMRDHIAEDVRECTKKERWQGNTIYAVMEYAKAGGLKARATKGGLFESETDAEMFIMEKNLTAEVVRREAQPTRCTGNYCSVSQFCEQYKKINS